MPQARYGSLPFQESIDFFRSKLNIPTERWNDVWRDGHNSGFMIAGALKNDLLNDFRQAVDSAIAEGKSLSWFKSQFKEIRAKHGWDHTGSSSWRSKVIYDTNMRQSYNAGRYEQLQHFAYWEYQHGDSRFPRPMHLSWHNLLLPKDDPWWKTHFPQNGWGCKCKVRGRSQQYVDRKGITLNAAPKDGIWQWTDKVTGESHDIPKGIDPGFDYAPKKSNVQKQQKKITKQKAKPFVPPPRIAPTAFSTLKKVDIHSLNKVLNDLKETPAAPEIAKLGLFLDKYQTKTLFIKRAEMSRGIAARKIKDDVGDYLGMSGNSAYQRFTTSSRPEGFTSISYEHVVVKALSSHNLNKVNVHEMIAGLRAIMKDGANGTGKYTFPTGKRWFGFSEANGSFDDNESRFLVWLHEIGHQVHYKAGIPNRPTNQYMTQYSNTNDKEWFAEHFSAYILGRIDMLKLWPDVTQWFDNIMNNL